ncbi:hypothetical protein NQZ68_028899, partial [Dissostichus eleginoides]
RGDKTGLIPPSAADLRLTFHTSQPPPTLHRLHGNTLSPDSFAAAVALRLGDKDPDKTVEKLLFIVLIQSADKRQANISSVPVPGSLKAGGEDGEGRGRTGEEGGGELLIGAHVSLRDLRLPSNRPAALNRHQIRK